jgi:membrane associated rhomboid family serine protease
MRQVVVGAGARITVDVCTLCQFVWTDAGELEQMPLVPPHAKPQEPALPQEVKEALAIAKVKALAQQARRSDDWEGPDNLFQAALLVLGLPVEEENYLHRHPWMTWLTAFTIAMVSVAAFFDLDKAIRILALIPAEWWRYGGITLFTSFFVHASFLHLVGNLYFLLVFGNNVEDRVGHGRFLLLLMMATLMGNILHIAFDPRPDIPVVGASGGISGIVLFYALAFPNARIYLMVYFRVFSMPAWGFVLIWLLWQFATLSAQISGLSGVSALAHLGGAMTGFGCWLLWRHEQEKFGQRV